jgi:hypothetical protein
MVTVWYGLDKSLGFNTDFKTLDGHLIDKWSLDRGFEKVKNCV